MGELPSTYTSGEVHGDLQASEYGFTHDAPHRYLAYRDIPALIGCSMLKTALDFGSGTGASTRYLFDQGFAVVGVDKSPAMVKEAKLHFPYISFSTLKELESMSSFDLVFSSFVLFELATKLEILDYLNTAAAKLNDNGIFVGITGSENLHCSSRDWMSFHVNYTENQKPESGAVVKLRLKGPEIEFSDYYWREADYVECFSLSDLELIKIHHPLGYKEEHFNWKDETTIAPFVIFVARKKSGS